MNHNNGMNGFPNFAGLLGRRPQAWAAVQGSERYSEIYGVVRFYQTTLGVVVSAEITGLPDTEDPCMAPIFAFHIHEGGRCSGNSADPFADVGTHYNPEGCLHPYHAGDL
ncbi:MAG: superoxide dismutase family protein, partial [Clostridia bacterium]|nr:superoxide dismutase family protein [Clostridia bacterium]